MKTLANCPFHAQSISLFSRMCNYLMMNERRLVMSSISVFELYINIFDMHESTPV